MRNNNKRKSLFFIISLLFFILILTSLFFVNFRLAEKRRLLKAELYSLTNRSSLLQDKNNLMSAKMSQKELELYLERIAREDLNFKRDGESVIVFPLGIGTTSSETEGQGIKNFWTFIFGAD